MYRGRLVVAALVVSALAGVAFVGVLRTRQETRRALDAEALATQRAAQARAESVAARRAAARLIYEEAAQRSGEQALGAAAQRAGQSLVNHDNPDARGLLGALAAQPHPRARHLHTLPPCPLDRWSLTADAALCHGGARAPGAPLARSWRAGRWGWQLDSPSYKVCTIEQLASVDDVLFVNTLAHEQCAHGALTLDPATGTVVSRDDRPGKLLVSGHTTRMTLDQQQLLDLPASRGLCAGKILNAARASAGDVWLICDSYEVWRLGPGASSFVRAPVSPQDSAHSLVFSPVDGRPWFASSQGRLFTLGDTHLAWEVGESVKEMAFLPGSSLLAILGMRGALRVFDTSQRTWRFTMARAYQDIQVAPGGVLRALGRTREVTEWTFATNPRIGRYRGPAGFSMAAWSRDQSLILGVDGRGYAHMFAPFDGERWAPVSWNNAVGKWVAASPEARTFHMVGIRARGVHTASIQDGALRVEVDARYDDAVSSRKRLMFGPDHRALYMGYGAEVQLESPGSGEVTRWRSNFGSVPSDADTSRQHRFVAFASPDNVTVWDWEAEAPTRVSGHGADAVSVNARGAVLAARALEVVSFDASGRERARWSTGGSRILDVEWIPGQERAVLGHLDGSVTVWDTRRGSLLARGRQHDERVTKVDVTGDGRWLVTTSWDGTLVVWDLEDALADLEELLGPRPTQ